MGRQAATSGIGQAQRRGSEYGGETCLGRCSSPHDLFRPDDNSFGKTHGFAIFLFSHGLKRPWIAGLKSVPGQYDSLFNHRRDGDTAVFKPCAQFFQVVSIAEQKTFLPGPGSLVPAPANPTDCLGWLYLEARYSSLPSSNTFASYDELRTGPEL